MSTSDWQISDRCFSPAPEAGWVFYVAGAEAVEANGAFRDLYIGRYAFDLFWDHVATKDLEYRFFPQDDSFNTAVPEPTRDALRAAWRDYAEV
jgi:hypothetical protein